MILYILYIIMSEIWFLETVKDLFQLVRVGGPTSQTTVVSGGSVVVVCTKSLSLIILHPIL